jgi:UDP-glucose 4-epimerase
VRDAVEALTRLMEIPAAVGEVFNVGAREEVTIHRLAELVRDAAGSSSPIQLVPYAEAYAAGFEDMMRRVPDVSKLQRVTGFAPSIPLQRIIDDVVADQRARISVPSLRSRSGVPAAR